MFITYFKNIQIRLGNFIRTRRMRTLFKNRSLVSIERDCVFDCPQNMQFGLQVSIGQGSYFSACQGKIEIGDNTAFNNHVHINASIGGEINIGNDVLVGPNVVMRTANHDFSNPQVLIRNQGHIIGDIIIEDDVWISAGVILVSGIRIGKGAVIGAGAVVTKDIPSMAVAVGVPAKVIKYRS